MADIILQQALWQDVPAFVPVEDTDEVDDYPLTDDEIEADWQERHELFLDEQDHSRGW